LSRRAATGCCTCGTPPGEQGGIRSLTTAAALSSPGTGDAASAYRWRLTLTATSRTCSGLSPRARAVPAVIERGRKTSYAALRERGGHRRALLEGGLRPNDRVAILLQNGRDAVAAFFAVVAAGGIAVILNQALRPRQMRR